MSPEPETTGFGAHELGHDSGSKTVAECKNALPSKAENKYWDALISVACNKNKKRLLLLHNPFNKAKIKYYYKFFSS